MLARVIDLLNEYLRINAIRRMLSVVKVRKSEIAGIGREGAYHRLFESQLLG